MASAGRQPGRVRRFLAVLRALLQGPSQISAFTIAAPNTMKGATAAHRRSRPLARSSRYARPLDGVFRPRGRHISIATSIRGSPIQLGVVTEQILVVEGQPTARGDVVRDP